MNSCSQLDARPSQLHTHMHARPSQLHSAFRFFTSCLVGSLELVPLPPHPLPPNPPPPPLRVSRYTLGAVYLQLLQVLLLENHEPLQAPLDPSLFIHRFADREWQALICLWVGLVGWFGSGNDLASAVKQTSS